MIDEGKLVNGLSYLNSMAEEDSQISFVLEDLATREQIHIPSQKSRNLGFAAFRTVELSGKAYTLTFWRDIGILHSIDGTLYRITLLELIVFSLSFIICGAIMHIRYVKPILHLKNETEKFLQQGAKFTPKKRSDELGELENSFYRMTVELDEEKSKQNQMIASISHDIKTPLTSLMGFSERLIKKDLDKEKQTAYLKNIYTQAQNIESIVEDFDEYLSFSLERRMHLQTTEVSFVCRLLDEEYTEPLMEKGASLILQNKCEDGTTISLDIAKIRRVFANLIGNALRHNDGNELVVAVTAEEYGNYILFTIKDNGKGVSAEDFEHIFEPFYTSDKSRKVSGLGLSICRQIVESHGGTISAKNAGGGFTVIINIPKA